MNTSVPNQKSPVWTAAQIASALKKSKRTVLLALAHFPPSGQVKVKGQSANGWNFLALPQDYRTQLEAAATAQGCRNAEHLLALASNPPPELAPAPNAPLNATTAPDAATQLDYSELTSLISSFKDTVRPTSCEIDCLWVYAFECFGDRLAICKSPKREKRALLAFLFQRAPFLSGTMDGLRKQFDRKLELWNSRGAVAIKDHRHEKSGRFRAPKLSDADRDKLAGHAVLACGGRVAQAWRELVERRELSEEILSYYLANPRSKSYVPKAISDTVKYEVAAMYDQHHGPRQARLNGPHINRDWSAVHSLDWFQADDFTFPIYFRAPDGNGGWTYMRGQVLLMIDLRSTRILGFLLLSERNYNARAIRTLITKVCDEYGLPRKGFYFENGIWKKSKIITGAKDAPPMSWGETEMGLREFGLKFVHAQLPRGKPVERVGGLMQDLMEGLPGYVGRNEMTEKFERVQKLKRDAERGEPGAVAQFMDEEEWSQQFEKLCAKYNASIQNGKMCKNASPDETFEQCQDRTDPPVKFCAECRYLLANHKRPVRVKPNGILIDGSYYYGAEIADRKGQNLLAWIDPETPDFITVTDMNRKNAVTVPRAKGVPGMEATADQLADAQRQIEGFVNHTKARYRILKASRPINFRPMVADRRTVELGQQIGEQRTAIEKTQKQATSRARTVLNRAQKLGLPSNTVNAGVDGERGTELMIEAMAAMDKENATPENR